MAFLDNAGVSALWAKAKATFGARLTVSGTTLTLQNRADTPATLSQATIPNATSAAPGAMSAADKSKLDGVASGANAYSLPAATASALGGVKVGTNLSISSGVLSATDTTYPAATTSAQGLMSAADKVKLNGIATGANAYSLPAATASALGGVKVGANLSVASDGTLSASAEVPVDSALSSTSENPVQNKVVVSALAGKLSTTGTAAAATKLATARSISLTGDATGSASFNGTANAAIAVALDCLTEAEIDEACGIVAGEEETVCEAYPVNMVAITKGSTSPAERFGGTWYQRTDTFLFMGYSIWERVS